MTQLTASDIDRLAQLSRLALSPEQAEAARGHINHFFELVEKMEAVNTQGLAPLQHPVAMVQDIALRLRPDVVSEGNQREANLQNAPATEDGLILVPRVIE
ncbi:MAG: Asp-tRNA(Asn)/Glu-tRNA(Gln) amidotransferase subunit GatC [Brachymonas sp.]|jgi:aspartyl-tRNA(Asn)/glutamyl-tRNA(Gln) amidotransferase subunit C